MLRDLQWLRFRHKRADSPVSENASNFGGRNRAHAHGDSLVDPHEHGDVLRPEDNAVLPTIVSANATCAGVQDASDSELRMLNKHAASIAEQLSVNVDFCDVRSLLDISGQAGVISNALCDCNPRLVATVFDPPKIGMTGDLAIDHDAVLMQQGSGSTPDLSTQRLYGRAFQGLRPGGLLLVHDFMAGEVLGQPESATGKVLIVSTELLAAGFTNLQQICLGGALGQLLVGRKPFAITSPPKALAERFILQQVPA